MTLWDRLTVAQALKVGLEDDDKQPLALTVPDLLLVSELDRLGDEEKLRVALLHLLMQVETV